MQNRDSMFSVRKCERTETEKIDTVPSKTEGEEVRVGGRNRLWSKGCCARKGKRAGSELSASL